MALVKGAKDSLILTNIGGLFYLTLNISQVFTCESLMNFVTKKEA